MNLDLEEIIAQNNEKLLSQLAALLAQQNTPNKGGVDMPRKLKYGQGTVHKRRRKNQRGTMYEWYEVKWFDEYGRRQSTTAKTKDEGHKILSKQNKRSMKNNSRKELVTFGTAIMKWYTTFGNRNAGEKRNELNLTQLKRIPKTTMDKLLTQVFAQELQEHLDYVESKHGPNPKWWTKLLLTAFLKHAFNQGWIKNNFGGLLIAEEPGPQREKNILPRELEDKFISFFSPSKNSANKVDYRPYVKGLIYTGCRISEFATIGKYEDTQTDYQKGVFKCRETKSIRAKDRRRGILYKIREIPILPPIADYNFPLPTLTHDRIQYNFRSAVAKLKKSDGIDLKLTPHDMRHTYQSRLNELGISDSVSMEILGWKTKKMQQHYTHNTKELIDREIAKIKESTILSSYHTLSNVAEKP